MQTQQVRPLSPDIYSVPFVLLCASSFLFSASFSMMLPELPKYLTSLGGADYKGWIIALFTLTAGISRPFSGKLADTIGRVRVMAFGSLVCFACGFLYPVLTTVSGFLWLRLMHGFSTGFKPTGTAAYVADIVPENRRGEAMGIQGISGSIGMSLGPVLGSFLTDYFSINTMFYASSVLALLSILILLGMKETLPDRQAFQPGLLLIKPDEWFEPAVWLPFLVMFLLSFSSGVIITVVPDLCEFVGLPNKGLFFTVYTASSLLIRLVAGRISDRYGRQPILRVSAWVMVVGMAWIGFSGSVWWLVAGALIFGISWGINTPTLNAWAIDLSHPDHRGKAIATVSIGLEFGIMAGAFVSAALYQNQPDRFAAAFLSASVCAALAFFIMQFQRKPRILG